MEQGGLSVKRVGVKVWRAIRSGLIGAVNNGRPGRCSSWAGLAHQQRF
jgi:hypothetical protein